METIYRIADRLWKRFVKWLGEEKHQERFILTCFVLSLLPLLILSFYNHPAMDDFNYGILTAPLPEKLPTAYTNCLKITLA